MVDKFKISDISSYIAYLSFILYELSFYDRTLINSYMIDFDISTCNVVVITVVSHTTGPQFDPGQVQYHRSIFK